MSKSNSYINLFSSSYACILSFNDVITHSEITSILNEIKSIESIQHINRRRLYSIVNELLENTLLHQKKDGHVVDLYVMKSENSVRVITINNVDDNDYSYLLGRSSDVNSLNKQELKERYKSKVVDGEIGRKNTIGVGLELVRLRSENKIMISLEGDDSDKRAVIDVKLDL